MGLVKEPPAVILKDVGLVKEPPVILKDVLFVGDYFYCYKAADDLAGFSTLIYTLHFAPVSTCGSCLQVGGA